MSHKLFEKLCTNYDFELNIIYGKIKDSNTDYDKKLYAIINRLQKIKNIKR